MSRQRKIENVLLIGAASGIGEALAASYAEHGCKVWVTGRRVDLLRAFCSNYESAHYGVLDVRNPADALISLQQIADEAGVLDLIWICAGVGTMNMALDFQQELPAIDTNVRGWTAVVTWAFRLFIQQGYGHLAAISSVAGLRGLFPAPSYAASKAYQISYLEALRQHALVSGLPVYVTDVRPGFVRTPLLGDTGPWWGIVSVEKVVPVMLRAVERKRAVCIVPNIWVFVGWCMRRFPLSWLAVILKKACSKTFPSC